jgi:hypothetical protein
VLLALWQERVQGMFAHHSALWAVYQCIVYCVRAGSCVPPSFPDFPFGVSLMTMQGVSAELIPNGKTFF